MAETPTISYQTYRFDMAFERSVVFQTFPTFVFRSVLGRHLKQITCILRNRECETCPVNGQCAYGFIFESPVDKNNPHLKGRNRRPHPFTLYVNAPHNTPMESVRLDLTLFGPAISHFPYLYFALKQAGQDGILRTRIPYTIRSVHVRNRNILKGPEKLDLDTPVETWSMPEEPEAATERTLHLHFLSPIRLKAGGRHLRSFSFVDLLTALSRRLALLCSFYGNNIPIPPDRTSPSCRQEQARLYRVDYPRYSARQKQELRMGGLMGTLTANGPFTAAEWSLLQGGSIFHAGKSTTFGFGRFHIGQTPDSCRGGINEHTHSRYIT